MSEPDFSHPSDPLDPPTDGRTPPPLPAGAFAPSNPAPAGPALGPSGRLVDPSIPHDQRTYALLMHLSILLMNLVVGFFLVFVVPLVMWRSRRGQSRFLDDHGREALNFNLTITLYAIVSLALMPVCWTGAPLMVATIVLAIVGAIRACLASSRGEYFRYPMCVRFIR
jgi:hypothetical protein